MSVHTKKHLIKVAVGDEEFELPKKQAKAILSLVEGLDQATKLENSISSELIFKQIAKKRPKGAVYLRGLRTRENMSQKKLEKLTGILVSNISKYESGNRKITENIAKKLAKAFKVNFKKFLD